MFQLRPITIPINKIELLKEPNEEGENWTTPPFFSGRGALNLFAYLYKKGQAFLAAAFAALAFLPRVLTFFTLVVGLGVLSSFKRAALPRSSRR